MKFEGDAGGETHAPTMGPNFVRSYRKGHSWLSMFYYHDNDVHRACAPEEQRWAHTCAKVVGDLEQAAPSNSDISVCRTDLRAADRLASREARAHARWKALIRPYTGSLFSDLNKCGRLDKPRLDIYARYTAALMKESCDWGFCSPPSARYAGGTLYRGIKNVPKTMMSMYQQGRRFTWCQFVSMSKKNPDVVGSGVSNFASDAKGGQAWVFEIECPAYSVSFHVWDLGDASKYKHEGEVLAPPFTKWEVVTPPKAHPGSGKIHLKVRGVGQYMLGQKPKICTVIVHQGGFAAGAGRRWARRAFHRGVPGWMIRRSADGAWTPVRGRTAVLGLFTDAVEAAKWMAGVGNDNPDALFRILTADDSSQVLLELYFQHFCEDTYVPSEILIWAGHGGAGSSAAGAAGGWEEFSVGESYKATARVRKTADEKVVDEFLSPARFCNDVDDWVYLRDRQPPVWVEKEGMVPCNFDSVGYFWSIPPDVKAPSGGGKECGIVYGNAQPLYREESAIPAGGNLSERASQHGVRSVVVARKVRAPAEWAALVDREGVPMAGLDDAGDADDLRHLPEGLVTLACCSDLAPSPHGPWTALLFRATPELPRQISTFCDGELDPVEYCAAADEMDESGVGRFISGGSDAARAGQHVAEQCAVPWVVGGIVQMRDDGEEWKCGVVTEVAPSGRPKVRFLTSGRAFFWREVEPLGSPLLPSSAAGPFPN